MENLIKEESKIHILDNKYNIIQNLGEGAFGTALLVQEIKTGDIYVAKIPFEENDTIFENEIKVFKHLKEKKIDNSFIINFYNDGIGPIHGEKIIKEKIHYFIMEYAQNEDLLKFLRYSKGIEEKYCKVIFEKILKGINTLHKAGICHRDIKPNNILLDKNYNPKICDFGLSTSIAGNKGTGKLNDILGNEIFRPPEMYLKISYNGVKSDIFSLGVTLFMLVTNGCPFSEATKNDKNYKKIIKISGKEDIFEINNLKKYSPQFMKLYIKMIAYKEKNRPDNIDQILKHEWFEEIRKLNSNERKKLEDETLFYLKEKQKIVDSNFKQEQEIEKKLEGPKRIYESFKEGDFKNEINIKFIKLEKEMNNYLKIKGNFNPVEFMNKLSSKISLIFKCEVTKSSESLKFNVLFNTNKKEKNKEDKENGEDEENEKEKKKENIIFDKIDFDNLKLGIEDCRIEVELFKMENNGFLLKFLKILGNLFDYYEYLLKIMSLAKDIIKNSDI